MSRFQDIGPQDAWGKVQEEGAVIIDVREPAEFEIEHVKGALNLPLSTLNADAFKRVVGDRHPILMCKSGVRSGQACEVIQAMNDGYVLAGGMAYWNICGLPVERARGSWWALLPIERRVQLVLGLMLISSTILTLAVHMGFMVIPLFIGAGLTFAGVTGWCGLAKILARI